MADVNIKVLVILKLQLKRHTGTLTFTSVHLMYLMIYFLYRKLEKIIVSDFFFKFNNYLFLTRTTTTNKLDEIIPVAHFQDLKYRYSKRYLNYKQIRRQHIGNACA